MVTCEMLRTENRQDERSVTFSLLNVKRMTKNSRDSYSCLMQEWLLVTTMKFTNRNLFLTAYRLSERVSRSHSHLHLSLSFNSRVDAIFSGEFTFHWELHCI